MMSAIGGVAFAPSALFEAGPLAVPAAAPLAIPMAAPRTLTAAAAVAVPVAAPAAAALDCASFVVLQSFSRQLVHRKPLGKGPARLAVVVGWWIALP